MKVSVAYGILIKIIAAERDLGRILIVLSLEHKEEGTMGLFHRKKKEESMYYLYFFSKTTKYIALVSLVITLFSDLPIFNWLCCLIFVDLALDFSVIKCSILQMIGIYQIKHKFGDALPSADRYQSAVTYRLPFDGRWVVVNGSFEKEYSHSWNVPTQRYAYDFIMLDESGRSYGGEFDRCSSYFCYGRDILAPADGVVVEILNQARDSAIFTKGRFLSRAKHIAGNYIVIQHAQNEYSTLAHLQKDSIAVSVGDVVSSGDFIARCGNTGNSTEPHLHVQLQTGRSFYNSAGLPVLFDQMELSKVTNYEAFDPRPHMVYDQVPDGSITRGFSVENRSSFEESK